MGQSAGDLQSGFFRFLRSALSRIRRRVIFLPQHSHQTTELLPIVAFPFSDARPWTKQSVTVLAYLFLMLNVSSEAASEVLQARPTLPFSRIDPIGAKLLYFDDIAGGYPPDIRSADDLEKVKREWYQTERELVAGSKMEGKSFATELRLGHLYRYGHNLDITDALENSRLHFRKAIELAPTSVDAHIGLAVLIVNADAKYATEAEELFKKAIALSKGQRTPKEAIFGLFFSYYYQGRLADAIGVADKYIAENPTESDMQRLLEIARSALNRAN